MLVCVLRVPVVCAVFASHNVLGDPRKSETHIWEHSFFPVLFATISFTPRILSQELKSFCSSWIMWDPSNSLAYEFLSKAHRIAQWVGFRLAENSDASQGSRELCSLIFRCLLPCAVEFVYPSLSGHGKPVAVLCCSLAILAAALDRDWPTVHYGEYTHLHALGGLGGFCCESPRTPA